jgi:hypothetical protein
MVRNARLTLWFALLITTAVIAGACSTSPSTDNPDAQQIETGEIRKTLHQYAIFLDDGRVQDFLDLFTEDAVFTAAGFVYEGREGTRRELAEKDRRPGKHLPFSALIEFESPTAARAWSDFIRVKITKTGDPTMWKITSIGRYYDQLVRGEGGRWRFARRDVQLPEMENLQKLVEPKSE